MSTTRPPPTISMVRPWRSERPGDGRRAVDGERPSAGTGCPRPSEYATRSADDLRAGTDRGDSPRMAPSVGPMQGVQPTAKIAPSAKPPTTPLRLAARAAIAKRSSGRQERTRRGRRRTPMRFRPRTMSTMPPIWRRSGTLSRRGPAAT